jgi:hypothetical protein
LTEMDDCGLDNYELRAGDVVLDEHGDDVGS